MHIGQAIVAPLKLERQPLVVDAQLMQQRGMKIVDTDGILRNVIREFVGLAVSHSGADSSP